VCHNWRKSPDASLKTVGWADHERRIAPFDKPPAFLLGGPGLPHNFHSVRNNSAMRVFAAAAAFIGLIAIPPAFAAEPRVQSERFDDWYYRCITPGDVKDQAHAKAQCEVVQIAQTKQGHESVNLLTISVSEALHGAKKDIVVTVLAPQNVYLPGGLGLSIGAQNKSSLHYRNCNNAGCWVQHNLDGKTLDAMKSGQEGFATIHLIDGKHLNIKFSLKGFKEALQTLQSGKHAVEQRN
jgi:invasion protein IalB